MKLTDNARSSADWYRAYAKTARELGFDEIADWFEELAHQEDRAALRDGGEG